MITTEQAWDRIQTMDLNVPEPEEKVLVGTLFGMRVYVVNDNWVKQNFCADFTEGSNGQACDVAYDEDVIKHKGWIPKDEFWLSSAINANSRPFILLHEFLEAQLMVTGKSYEEAHDTVLRIEMQKRKEVLGEVRIRAFSEYLFEMFPGMDRKTEALYHRKNRNGRKKGGIMPRPPVKAMKGVASSTGKRADSFFY